MKKIILVASILITLLGCEVNTKGFIGKSEDIQTSNSDPIDRVEPEKENAENIQSETDNSEEAVEKIPHEVLEKGNSERLEGNSVLHEESGAQALKNMQIQEYLSVGDSVTIEKGRTSVLKRTLTDFEIIKDPNYKNRKAIVFYFTEENLTDNTVNPGLYGISETLLNQELLFIKNIN